MKGIVLGPTSTAQWQRLICEAEQACAIQLGEEVESYLVFLLMRFMQRPEMAASVLGLEFLTSHHSAGQLRLEQLRDVGDKCLLFSGLFPGRAKKRRVSVNYFVQLGQSAYDNLADLSQFNLAELYTRLCQKFVPMMDILHNLRQHSSLEAFDAFELWSQHSSQAGLEQLQRYSQALPVNFERKTNKH